LDADCARNGDTSSPSRGYWIAVDTFSARTCPGANSNRFSTRTRSCGKGLFIWSRFVCFLGVTIACVPTPTTLPVPPSCSPEPALSPCVHPHANRLLASSSSFPDQRPMHSSKLLQPVVSSRRHQESGSIRLVDTSHAEQDVVLTTETENKSGRFCSDFRSTPNACCASCCVPLGK
jgi:hypothetical protein